MAPSPLCSHRYGAIARDDQPARGMVAIMLVRTYDKQKLDRRTVRQANETAARVRRWPVPRLGAVAALLPFTGCRVPTLPVLRNWRSVPAEVADADRSGSGRVGPPCVP